MYPVSFIALWCNGNTEGFDPSTHSSTLCEASILWNTIPDGEGRWLLTNWSL